MKYYFEKLRLLFEEPLKFFKSLDNVMTEMIAYIFQRRAAYSRIPLCNQVECDGANIICSIRGVKDIINIIVNKFYHIFILNRLHTIAGSIGERGDDSFMLIMHNFRNCHR